MTQAPKTSDVSSGELKRVLSLTDLIVYGIVLIMPIAPIPLFGLVQQLSNGHAVTTILVAMVAMMLTAYSYGRMAREYPAAGSAYTYVSKGVHPIVGFLVGWAMLLDYLLVPLICTIYGALSVHRLFPVVPYAFWCALIVIAMTTVNLIGIRATANTNFLMMIAAFLVVLPYFGLAIHWLLQHQGWPGLLSTEPFYNPSTFHWKALAVGTSLAALTYGGFDGVSTLSEEVKNPRRNIMLATVFVCFFTGVFGGLQIYLAQRVLPGFHYADNVETAFMDVARVVGGTWLFNALGALLIVANVGCALTAQAALSRLLFGMGRDAVLPRRFFGHLSKKHNVPSFNILLIGLFAFFASLFFDYERAAELINFGAFLAFMGVNAAVIKTSYSARANRAPRFFWDALLPALGFIFCFVIWLNLSHWAKVTGGVWFCFGFIYNCIKTRGFRTVPAELTLVDIG